HPDLVVITELHICELALGIIDLQDSKICTRVGAYQLRIEFGAVIENDAVGVTIRNNVVVGDEITVFRNEEAGPLCHRTFMTRTRLAAIARTATIGTCIATRLHAEITEEAL